MNDTTGTECALDTSGWVWLQHGQLANTYWEDLSPFEQGYIEALFNDGWDWPSTSAPGPKGYSDLAPSTLAAILKDCESKTTGALEAPNGYEGRRYWERRQAGEDAYFPPLTASLGDDG